MPATFAACPPEHATHQIKLPRTAKRGEISYIKLIRRISPSLYGASAFDGPILRAGGSVNSEALGARPVILEYAGPSGPPRRVGGGWGRGAREQLYLLWRYNWRHEEWMEVGRACAFGSEWVLALRPLALAAMGAPKLLDILGEGDRIVSKVVDLLDDELRFAIGPVKARSLGRLYDEVAARIANDAA